MTEFTKLAESFEIEGNRFVWMYEGTNLSTWDHRILVNDQVVLVRKSMFIDEFVSIAGQLQKTTGMFWIGAVNGTIIKLRDDGLHFFSLEQIARWWLHRYRSICQ